MPPPTAVALAALAVLVGVLGSLAGAPPRQVPGLGWLVVPVALGFLLPIPRFRARPVPLALVVVGALALLGAGPWPTVLVTGAGFLVALPFGGRARVELALPDLISTVAAGVLLTGGADLLRAVAPTPAVAATHGPVPVATLVLLWGVLVLGGPLWEGLLDRRVGLSTDAYVAALRSSWTTGAVVAATATLGGVVGSRLGLWTILLLAVPLGAARIGLGRLVLAQEVHRQAISAMSRLPEELGDVDREHGARVAEAAARVAQELGMPGPTIDAVELAGNLHELGRIRWEPGQELTDEAVAAASSSLVRETGDHELAARIIEAHRPSPEAAPPSPDVQLAATLVRLACDLDRAQAVDPPVEAFHAVARASDPRDAELLARVRRNLRQRPLPAHGRVELPDTHGPDTPGPDPAAHASGT
jgi:hypothetical protein